MGRVRKRLADDAGFSVTEVVIAAAIMFFAMTALIGLLGASTSLGATAKGKTVLTNVLSSEMDQIRALPFEQVGVKNVDSGGTLVSPSAPVSSLGYTVVLTYRVTSSTTEDGSPMKEVQIVATGTRRGEPPVRSMSTMEVRDVTRTALPGGDPGGGGGDDQVLTIEFTDTSPEAGSILEGNRNRGVDGTLNGELWIEARAKSPSSTITKFEFTVVSGGPQMLLRDANHAFAAKATYVVPSGGDPHDKTWKFNWNTLQVNDSGVPQVEDGVRQVTITAWDDSGNPSVSMSRNFLVDNKAPASAPGGIKLTPLYDLTNMSQTLKLEWGAVLDGTEPAPQYFAELYQNGGGSASSDFTTWLPKTTYQNPTTIAAGPLTMYGMRAQALSILNRPSPWGNASPSTVLTKMPLTGAYDVKCQNGSSSAKRNWSYITRLTIPKPGIQYDAATLNVKMLRTGGGTTNSNGSTAGTASPIDITAGVKAAWAAGNAFAWSETMYQDIHKNTHPTPPSYQLQISIKPVGSTQQTVLSNYGAGADAYGLAAGAEMTNQPLVYTAPVGW